jgi:site-specific DNA recombinase
LAEFYLRRLHKAGVEVLSITQAFGADASGDVVQQSLAAFDECQSRENAKHTRRAMLENARQGYWNGETPPFGFRTEAAGQNGARLKKVLVKDPAEAAIIERIFAFLFWRGRAAARREGDCKRAQPGRASVSR